MECPACGRPDAEFYESNRARCKQCVKDRARSWQAANPDRVLAIRSTPEQRAKALARARRFRERRRADV